MDEPTHYFGNETSTVQYKNMRLSVEFCFFNKKRMSAYVGPSFTALGAKVVSFFCRWDEKAFNPPTVLRHTFPRTRRSNDDRGY